MSRFRNGAFRGSGRKTGASMGSNAGRVRFTQRIEVDSNRALALMSSLAIGFVKRRTDKGRDVNDQPFAPYSQSYREALTEAGENPGKVDLTLTGGMVNSIHELSRTARAGGGSVIIGPGTGSSPRVSLRSGTARRTGGRGPAHNIVGAYLHFGTPKMRARKFLGLTLKERRKIGKALVAQSARVLKERKI